MRAFFRRFSSPQPSGMGAFALGASLLALLTVGAIIAFFAFRSWRAHNLAETAVGIVEQSSDRASWEAAWQKVRAAERLAPDDLDVLRAAAKIAEVMDPRRAREFWDRCLKLSGGASEDVSGRLRTALVQDEYSLAETLIGKLRTIEGNSETVLRSEMKLHRILEDYDAAIRFGNQLVEMHPRAENHWFFVELCLSSPRLEDQELARSYLAGIAASNESLALEALRRLSVLGDLTEGENRLLARRMEELAVSREDKLLGLSAKLRMADLRSTDVAREAAGLFDLDEKNELLLLGRWLNQNGLYEMTLELISDRDALKRKDLFLVRLDALAFLDKWEEIQKSLERSNVPLMPFLEELFRMRALFQQGQMRRAQVAWEKAVQASSRSAEQLRYLVRYTSRLGMDGFTTDALYAMTELSETRRQGYEGLLKYYEKRQDARAVRDVLIRMERNYPKEAAVRNDLAYYNLLLNENIDQAVSTARELVDENPTYLSHQMTLVLGHLRMGEPEAALERTEALPVDWSTVSQRWRLLIAAVLAQNGRTEIAEKALGSITLSEVLPEEQQLIVDSFAIGEDVPTDTVRAGAGQ